MTNEEKIQLIGQKIFLLSQNMEKYKAELDSLRTQLDQLKREMASGTFTDQKIVPVIQTPLTPPVQQPVVPPVQQVQQNYQQQPQKPAIPKKEFHLEEYIGGKLVNIIGIILLVIGVSIGVKYAIDKELINELGRIVLGYAAGGLILAFSFFTRKKMKLFSAIIMSGGIAILYFTTYAGFAFYHKYDAPFAFTVMVLLTAFTVFAAHIYDYEVLAVIALVGAYAVPPLLRDDKGNVHIMFAYMAILNAGVLFVSFRKNWNWVTYSAYLLTWIIFAGWMAGFYSHERYFTTCFTFLNIFFVTFYAMFISYKILRKELFSVFDVLRIMSNSAVYFGIGYFLLNTKEHEDYLGLFCLMNAMIHLIVAGLCFRNKTADKKVVFMILTLVFTFITIAVPVQLEGNWVTMIWFTEMAVMWIMARRFNIPLYKHMAFGLSILGTLSLMHDWGQFYYAREKGAEFARMFANRYFLTSVFSIGALFLVNRLQISEEKNGELPAKKPAQRAYSVFFAILTGIFCYFGVVNEIHLKFENLFLASGTREKIDEYISYPTYDNTYSTYKVLWIIIFTAAYSMCLNLLNILWLKLKPLRITSWILNLISLFVCVVPGLIIVASLKTDFYVAVENNTDATAMTHYARYLLLPFIVLLLVNLWLFVRQENFRWTKSIAMWISHAVIVILLSNELTFQITERNYQEYERMWKVSWRTGYTILWAVYSMALITWGFTRKVKMIRFIGLTLFGMTVLYLGVIAFTMSRGYQLVTLCTIGIILILTGFLYQKFKYVILEKDRDETEPVKQSEQ
jgi:uncharacterized membrane protein